MGAKNYLSKTDTLGNNECGDGDNTKCDQMDHFTLLNLQSTHHIQHGKHPAQGRRSYLLIRKTGNLMAEPSHLGARPLAFRLKL